MSVRCPRCRNKLMQKSGNDTKLRIDGPLVFHDDGRCEARCKWCKSRFYLPVTLGAGEPRLAERFVLRK